MFNLKLNFSVRQFSNWKVLFYTFLFALLPFTFYLLPSSVKADDTPIPQIHFPCDIDTKNPEFASLRPYQAAACGDANKAYFCSNNLIFTETFQDFPQCQSQAPASGSFVCDLGAGKYIPDHNLTVNLADAELPILGNTELTSNSQNANDQIDNGTKMSEYVSWYLEGTQNKAESGANDASNTVDFSGPIQKIMPQAILDAQRIDTIDTIKTNVPQVDEDGNSTGKTEASNHNQIVVCAEPDNSGLFKGVFDFLGIGKFSAKPCYSGGGSAASGEMRLSDWNSKLNANVALNSAIQAAIAALKVVYPFVPSGAIEQSIGDHWEYAKPPLPWDNGKGQPFATEAEYQKAYHEWRGNICAIIPVINHVVCFENIFVPSKYADMFQYVPLANTVDKHGAEADFIAEIQPSGETEIINKSYDIPKSSPLWMAHTQEDKDLSAFLNKSYTPQGVDSVPVPETTETNDCRVVDVRSNPGDNLFAGQTHGIIVPNVHYTITKVPCTVHTEVKENKNADHMPCGNLQPIGTMCTTKTVKCDAEINITLPTVTKTPWADEIWQSTVANSNSTFRKIYPKVGPGAPVSCIADTPTSTGVTYTPIDPVGNGADNFKVRDANGNNTTDNPQLQFPHIGSVYDYFLKGIQQALRPKGYGEGTPASGNYCSTKTTCDGTLFAKLGPPGNTTPEAHDYFSSQIKPLLTPQLIAIYAQAEQVTGVPCEILAGVHFEEGDNSPSASLQNGGPLSGSLLASAIQAGNEIKAKVGGRISTWDQAITALSRYNGGGNSNCGRGVPYTGPCPPPEGVDDLYPMAWIDPRHLVMYLIYCSDFTQCSPYPKVERPGVLTVATELYLSEGK